MVIHYQTNYAQRKGHCGPSCQGCCLQATGVQPWVSLSTFLALSSEQLEGKAAKHIHSAVCHTLMELSILMPSLSPPALTASQPSFHKFLLYRLFLLPTVACVSQDALLSHLPDTQAVRHISLISSKYNKVQTPGILLQAAGTPGGRGHSAVYPSAPSPPHRPLLS